MEFESVFNIIDPEEDKAIFLKREKECDSQDTVLAYQDQARSDALILVYSNWIHNSKGRVPRKPGQPLPVDIFSLYGIIYPVD